MPKLRECEWYMSGCDIFMGCSSLESVEMPSLLDVGDEMFFYCPNLKRAVLSSAKSIDSRAFADAVSLEEVIAPEVEEIGADAFRNCHALKRAYFPKARVIWSSVFSPCSSLSEVVMPEAEKVCRSAFAYCHNLKTVEMPKLREIDGMSFFGCENITTFKVHPDAIAQCNSFGSGKYFPKGCPEIAELRRLAFCREYDRIKALADEGDPYALYDIGMVYGTGKFHILMDNLIADLIVCDVDINKAVELWKKSAELGHVPSMNILAETYAESKGYLYDLDEALRYWRMASENGSTEAMKRLGEIFSDGRLTATDLTESRKYYHMAVKSGDYEALLALVRLNRDNPEPESSIPDDETEALYFRAEHGDVEAVREIARMYEEDSEESRSFYYAAKELEKDKEE